MNSSYSDYFHHNEMMNDSNLHHQLSTSANALNNSKSFASTFTSPSLASINTTSSSKAVLAALKALQDKIRRLETERSQALDEITTLKLQLKNQEIDYENNKQKEILNQQKILQDNKLNYDHLLQEKQDLESKISKILDKNSSITDLSNNLQMKIQMLEEEKLSLVKKSKDLENENAELELQIKQSQLHEKGKILLFSSSYSILILSSPLDMAHSLAHESKKNQEEIISLQSQIVTVQKQYQDVLLEKDSLQHRLVELDLLIEQLLTLNESLITQLSGKPFKFQGKSSTKKSKTSSTSSNVPPIESIAAEASKLLLKSLEKKAGSSSGSATAKAAALSKNLESIEHMKLMHKIYSDIARKVTKVSSSSSKKKHASPGRSKRSGGDTDYEDEERGYESSASTGKKTRIKMRKDANNSSNNQSSFSLLSNNTSSTPNKKEKKIKSALKRSNSNYSNVTNVTGDFTLSSSPAPHQQHHEIRLPRANSLQNMSNSTSNYDFDDYLNRSESVDVNKNKNLTLQNTRANANAVGNTSSNAFSGNPSISSRPQTTGTSTASVSKQDMDTIISQLEEEFNSLNSQYRNLLSNVSASSGAATMTQVPTSQNIQTQAEEIVQVIQKLHEKGEQIRLLKSPTKV